METYRKKTQSSWRTPEHTLRRKLRKLCIDETCQHGNYLIRRESARFAVLHPVSEKMLKRFSVGRSDYAFERSVSEVIAFVLGRDAAPELNYHGVIKSGSQYLARVVIREGALWLGPHVTAEEAALEYNETILDLSLERPLNTVPDTEFAASAHSGNAG